MPERTPWKDRPIGARGIVIGLGLVITLAAAASCAAAAFSGPEPSGPVSPAPAGRVLREAAQVVELNVHGRTVTCIYVSGQREGALSCDWEAK
jgi:hypothetical protein